MNFFLLVMRIPLDLCPDTSHKGGGFSKVLSEKSLEFISSRRDGIVTFNLGLMLLPAKVNSIPKERGCKKDALRAYGTGYVKMILALSTKVVVLHMGTFIIQVGVL